MRVEANHAVLGCQSRSAAMAEADTIVRDRNARFATVGDLFDDLEAGSKR